MSENRVIRRRGRLYCPHCKVFIGETENGFFRAGFIRLVARFHSIECVKCGGVSVFFNEENCRENGCDSQPILTNTEEIKGARTPENSAQYASRQVSTTILK